MLASIRGCGAFCLALAMLASAAQADLAPPGGKRRPSREVKDFPIVVKVDDLYDTPRLEIPTAFIEKAQKLSAVSPTQTIMVGMAGSLAVVGLFFAVRGKGKLRGAAVAITGVAATLATDSSLSADARPVEPPGRGQRVTLVLMQDDDAIYLTVSKNWLRAQGGVPAPE